MAERIKTDSGDTLTVSYNQKKRIIWAGVSPSYTNDPNQIAKSFFPELIRMIAKQADAQGYPRFAVTGIFCARFVVPGSWPPVKASCKIQAAPLFNDEKVASSAKDDIPMYFDTKSVIESDPDSKWVEQFDLESGIRGSVEITKEK